MDYDYEDNSRKTGGGKGKTTALVILGAILLALVIAVGYIYAMGVSRYQSRYPSGTIINGVEVGAMTVDEARQALNDAAVNKELIVNERGGTSETLNVGTSGVTITDDGALQDILSNYDPKLWLKYSFSTDEYTVDVTTELDEAAARKAISELNCFSEANITDSEDAYLVNEGKDSYIVAEVYGNRLDEDKAITLILEALQSGEESVDLDAAGCYIDPTVKSDDPTLLASLTAMQTSLNAVITYDFGDDRIVTCDSTVYSDWLSFNEDGTFEVSNDDAYNWVKNNLAYKFDTFGLTHTFTTSNGDTIQISGGDYGWCIARQDTTDALIEAIKAGEEVTLEPVYQYTAMNRGTDDIGGTYVEVSIDQQKVWCYKDYQLVVETDCVTGTPTEERETPHPGVWAIDAKKSPATLGTLDTMGYSSEVDYWMPFNGNVGLHDADWRSVFGGTIYKTNGSHGCVNLPDAAAAQIYAVVSIGTAVIVY